MEKRSGRLVGAAVTNGELAEWRRLQQNNLKTLGLPNKKEWPRRQIASSWQKRRGSPCQKKKEQSNLSRSSAREMG